MGKLIQITLWVLLILVAICTFLFFQFVKSSSSIPKVELRPLPPDSRKGSTLIWYKRSAENDIKHYIDSLDEFLSVYQIPGLTPGRTENMYNCDYMNLPPKGRVCDVNIKYFSPCNKENLYSYNRGSPCVFLKPTEVAGWIPEYYNTSSDLPVNMPEYLKRHIQEREQTRGAQINNVLWITCDGENPADKDYLGPVSYFPNLGFPGYFFPYQNQEGYLSPLTAVQFERPLTGVTINIECKIWARNIIHDKDNGVGLLRFQLLLD